MSRRDDRALLKDILAVAKAAAGAASSHRKSDLAKDPIWAWGLVKSLEIIGEAARQLSANIRKRSSNIPWPQIIGMRNRLVHAYFNIDREQVWKTLTDDLPPLIERIKTLLKDFVS